MDNPLDAVIQGGRLAQPWEKPLSPDDLLSNPIAAMMAKPTDRANLAADTGLRQGKPWEEIEGQVRGLGVDPEHFQQSYKLGIARKEIEGQGFSGLRGLAIQSLPFGDFGDVRGTGAYSEAQKRFQEGKASDEDIQTIAKYEEEQAGFERVNKNFGLGGKVLSGLAGVPKLVGEFYLGGKAIKGLGAAGRGLGILKKAPHPPMLAAMNPGLAGQLRSHVGRMAMLLPTQSGMYMEQAKQNNLAAGRDVDDIRGFPTALGHGYASLLVLGSLQNRLPGWVPQPGMAGRMAAKGVVGTGEMAAVDAAFGVADEFIENDAWKFNTGYGTIGHLVKGIRSGDGEMVKHALYDATATALTFSVFAGMHDRGPNEVFNRKAAQAVIRTHGELLASYKQRGIPPEVAGKAVQSFYGRIQRAQETNPDLTRSEARGLFENLPDPIKKPLFELVDKVLPEERPIDPGRLERRQAEQAPPEAETQIPPPRNLAEPPQAPESRPAASEPPPAPEPSPTPEVPPAATPAGSSRPVEWTDQIGKSLEAANLPPQQKAEYEAAVGELRDRLPDSAHEILNEELKGVRIVGSQGEVPAAWAEEAFPNASPKERAELAGHFADVGGTTINGVIVAGGSHTVENPTGRYDKPVKSAQKVVVHEIGHVLDGPGSNRRISTIPAWREAYEAEIRGRPGEQPPLTQYATKSPAEGWAEFIQSLWSGELSVDQARKEFPKSTDVVERLGLLPKQPAATVEPAAEPVKPEQAQIPPPRNLPAEPPPPATTETPPAPRRPLAERVTAAIDSAPNLAPEQRQTYRAAWEQATARMPAAARERMEAGLSDVVFHPDSKTMGVTAIRESIAPETPWVHRRFLEDKIEQMERGEVEWGGVYLPRTGRLHIDGGTRPHESTIGRLLPDLPIEQVYAHELGHVIDGPGQEFSRSRGWQDAASREMRSPDSLTKQATQSPAEAFAEFARLVYGSNVPRAEIETKFPLASAFFKERGLWAEEPGAGGPMKEVFDGRIPLDDQGGHVDTLKLTPQPNKGKPRVRKKKPTAVEQPAVVQPPAQIPPPRNLPADSYRYSQPQPMGGGGMRIAATDPAGREIGHVEYFVDGDRVQVADVKVASEHRRRGVATRLYDAMLAANPGKILAPSMRTDEGQAFRQSYESRRQPQPPTPTPQPNKGKPAPTVPGMPPIDAMVETFRKGAVKARKAGKPMQAYVYDRLVDHGMPKEQAAAAAAEVARRLDAEAAEKIAARNARLLAQSKDASRKSQVARTSEHDFDGIEARIADAGGLTALEWIRRAGGIRPGRRKWDDIKKDWVWRDAGIEDAQELRKNFPKLFQDKKGNPGTKSIDELAGELDYFLSQAIGAKGIHEASNRSYEEAGLKVDTSNIIDLVESHFIVEGRIDIDPKTGKTYEQLQLEDMARREGYDSFEEFEQAQIAEQRKLEEQNAATFERLKQEALNDRDLTPDETAAPEVEVAPGVYFSPEEQVARMRERQASRGPQPSPKGVGRPSAKQQSFLDRNAALDDLVRELPESQREPVRDALESLSDTSMRNAGLTYVERYVINQHLLGRSLEDIAKDRKQVGFNKKTGKDYGREWMRQIEMDGLAKLGESASIAFRQKLQAAEEAARLQERQGELAAGELTGAAEGEGRQRSLKWYEVLEKEMDALADRAAFEEREGTLTPEKEAEYKRELQRLLQRYDRGVAAEGPPPPPATAGGTGTPTRRPAPNRGRPDQQALFSPPDGGSEPRRPGNLFEFMEERQAERERLLAEREAALDARERELAEREARLAEAEAQIPAPRNLPEEPQPKKGKVKPTVETPEGRQLVEELKIAIQAGLLREGEGVRGKTPAEVDALDAELRRRAGELLDRVSRLPEAEQKAIAYEVSGRAGRSAQTARAEIERDLLAVFRALNSQLTSPPPGQADQIPLPRNLEEPVMGDMELLATARREIGLPEQVEKTPPYVRDAHRGVYLGKEEAVVTGKMMVGDVPRGLHEIAHHIAKKNKFNLDPVRLPAQVRLGFKQFDYDPARPMGRTAMQEGFAEWFRRRTTGSLENLTPAQEAASKHAEKLLADAGLTEYVDRQRARWDRLAAASAETRALKLMSQTGEPVGHTPQEQDGTPAEQVANRAYDEVIDSLGPYERMFNEVNAERKTRGLPPLPDHQNPRAVAQYYMHSAKAIAGRWFKTGIETIRDGQWVKIGPGMGETIATIKPGEVDRAGLFAVARHILSEHAAGRPVVPEHELRIFEEAMEELRADADFMARVVPAADLLTRANNATLEALASPDVHRLDPDLVQELIDMRPDYVELARALTDSKWKQSAYGGGRGERVKRLIHARSGTGEPIMNPFVSHHKRLLRVADALGRQMVDNSVAFLLQQPGMGKYGTFFEAAGESPKAEKIAAALRELGLDEGKIGETVQALTGERGESPYVTKPWPTDGTKPTKEWVGPDYKKTSIRVNNRALYDLWTGQNIDVSQTAKIFKVIADFHVNIPGYGKFAPFEWAGNVLRTGATGLSAGFQAFNIPRDYHTFWSNTINRLSMGELAVAYLTTFKGMVQILRGHDPTNTLFRQFMRERGSEHRKFAFSVDAPSPDLHARRSIWGVAKDALQAVGAGELAPRYQEWLNSLRKDSGKSKAELQRLFEEADRAAAEGKTYKDPVPVWMLVNAWNRAHEVTVPFGRLGTTTREINRLTPFFGPHIAALAKVARNWRDNPRGAGFALGAILATRLLYWSIVNEEEWYQELTPYERYNHFTVNIDGRLQKLPGPRDLGLAGGGVLMAMLDAAKEQNPDFPGLVRQSLDEFTPALPLPTPARAYLDLERNKDFLDRPIVPRRAQSLPWIERVADYQAPYIAKQMTGGLVSKDPFRLSRITGEAHGGRSVDEYYERLKVLEGERTVALRAGRPYANEKEYQRLHRIESQMTAINQRLRGEMKRGRRLVAGERPSEEEARKLRARQTELARRALGK